MEPKDASKSTVDAGPRPARGTSFAPGTRLGRYLVIEELGAGGMGVVYEAYDPDLERKVALKLMRAQENQRDPSRQRLIREARAMARVSHPNVVHVYEVGVLGDRVFVAMERLQGKTFARWRRSTEPSWSEMVPVLVQAGRGLAAAHKVGLVHRDFKPSNVMVGDDGRVSVLDFGLAGEVGESFEPIAGSDGAPHDSNPWPSLTATGAVMGTPAYMAREQHLGERVSAQADQFGYCVTVYEALYGAHPFGGGDDVAKRIMVGQPEPPPSASSVPDRIGAAVARGLSARPEDRWPSMEPLLAELDAAIADPSERARWRTALRWAMWIALVLVALTAALALIVLIAPPPHGHRARFDESRWGPDLVPRSEWNVALNRSGVGFPEVTTSRMFGCGQRPRDLNDGLAMYASWEHGVAFPPPADVCIGLEAFAPIGTCGPLDPQASLCERIGDDEKERRYQLLDLTVAERNTVTGPRRKRLGQITRAVPCGERQVTVELARAYRINAVRLWHMGKDNVPASYRIEAEVGGGFRKVFSTVAGRHPVARGGKSSVFPVTAQFQPVTTRRIRAVFDSCSTGESEDPRGGHGWLYEIEVFAELSRLEAWMNRLRGRR